MSKTEKTSKDSDSSDIFINPDEIDGEIVVEFKDKRVDYDKSDNYRFEDEKEESDQ